MRDLGIAYDILRREDGVTALSVNVGSVEFKPTKLILRRSEQQIDGAVQGEGPEPCVVLYNLPSDVVEQAIGEGTMPLFEFSRLGLIEGHDLLVTKE